MKKRVSEFEKISMKLAVGLRIPVAVVAQRLGYSDVTVYSVLGRMKKGKKHVGKNS